MRSFLKIILIAMRQKTKNQEPSIVVLDRSKEVREDEIRARLTGALDEVDDEDKERVFLWFIDFGKKMYMVANASYASYLKAQLASERNLYKKSLERLTSDSVKKPRFTTDEAMEITDIHAKGTIIKYFKDGTIQVMQVRKNSRSNTGVLF